jgi:hypothetical protein
VDTSYFVSGYIDDTYFGWERYAEANLTVDSTLQAEGTKFILIEDGATLSAETFLYGPTADVYAIGSIILAPAPILRTRAVIVGDLNA